MDDEARNGGRLRIRQAPVHGAVEVADRDRAVDIDRSVRQQPYARNLDIVLVADVAHDLFENVLQRDDPHELPVLVDHDGERGTPPPERLELLAERPGLWDEPGRAGEGHDIDLLLIAARLLDTAQEIFHMEDADDVFRRAPPQRDARHRLLKNRLDDLLGWLTHVRGDYFGAVDHDVRHRQVSEVQKSAQHVAVVFLEAALPVQKIDGAAQALMAGQ